MKHASQLQLLCGGVAFFSALIQAIDAANNEVHLETNIFDTRGAGQEVALALERAAYRGVRVNVLVDGVGTGKLPSPWAERFENAGVVCRVFSPVGALGLLGVWQPTRWRRLHRKLCVVDARVAFCGGINIVDDFLDRRDAQPLQSPRLDFAFQIQGELVLAIHETVKTLWQGFQGMRAWRISELLQAATPHHDKAQLVLRDNVRHRVQIERAYRKAIGAAHHDIVVACAFFFPGLRLLRALREAARRGVRVRLLLQGHYEYWVVYRAARQLYGQLLAAGVEIYEYQASFLHAKVAVIDQHWLTVGSSNLDPLSLLLAREANIVTKDKNLALSLHQSLCLAIEQGATKVEPHKYIHRAWLERVVDALAAAVLRFGVFLTGKRY